MTVLVGVRCSDGVVVGADSIATSTMGPNGLVQLPADKIAIVGDRVIVAGTGAVGLGQRFISLVTTHWNKKEFQRPCMDCLRTLTTSAVNDFRSTGVPFNPQQGFGYGALLAAPLDNEAQLVEFGLLDMQPELKTGRMNFFTMGSGQMLADPFMAFASRVLWASEVPDVQTAMFGVYWALAHTIQYAPGGVGGPIKLAVMRRVKGQWNARLLDEDELQEQAQHIQQIETRISDYPKSTLAEAETKAPPAPPAG